MRIGISAVHLVYGERDGVETQLVQLVRHVGLQAGDDEIVLLAGSEAAAMPVPDNVEVVECPVRAANLIARVLYEHRQLARVCVEQGLDVTLFPGAVMPLNLTIPGVVLINDMQPWVYPQNFALQKRMYLYYAVPRSAQKAAALVTISQHSRQDIVRLLKVDEAKVQVMPPAGPEYGRVEDQTVIASAREKYGLPPHYIMCLASSYPHKNLCGLVEAYAQFVGKDARAPGMRHKPGSARFMPEIGLALLGMYRQDHQRIQRTVKALGLGKRVYQPGRIDGEDLAALYSGARAFVFPSRFEGFGMPVLEAMACGTPVASSRATALAEVCGDAAVLFDPDDVGEMRAALEAVVFDEALRKEKVAAGYRRAGDFSWQETGKRLLRVLREAGSEPGI